MKALLKNQTIRIDAHQYGNREVNNWDNITQDIHLDKNTDYKIEGKKQYISIKIPLNSNRDISVVSRSKKGSEVPRFLQKEIQNVFKDQNLRERFVSQLKDILQKYPSEILDDDVRLNMVIDKICIAFGIQKENLIEETTRFSKGKKKILRKQVYHDDCRYTLKIDNKKLTLSGKDK